MRKLCFFGLLLSAAACTIESPTVIPAEETVITATASLPEGRTKMVYEDSYNDVPGIKAGWKTGDTFLALEINGSTVTPVTFTATASAGVKTTFTSSGAAPADASTKWVAVLGKSASFNGQSISCTYSGQNGSLQGLENFDYMTASASGSEPDFNYGSGKHLTYLLKIKMPEGVGMLEFNTCEDSREWTVSSNGEVTGCKADYLPKAVKTLSLRSATAAEGIVYLAVPAIDYSEAGLIVTAMSSDGKKSQGKVRSENFSSKGGRVGTFDMSTLALMDRPAPADAIKFLSVIKSELFFINDSSFSGIPDRFNFINCPRWAPFNLGASASPAAAESAYGSYFAWGETEPRGPQSGTYKYSGKQESIGKVRDYSGNADIPLKLRSISGTKYDAARVKWGSAWRMPRLEEMLSFTGDNETFSPQSGSVVSTGSNFRTSEVKEYKGVAVTGRLFSLNGVEVFFPYGGRFDEKATEASNVSKTGYYASGTLNPSSGLGEAYRFYVRGNQVDYMSQSCASAFSIRPVLAEETDEPAAPVAITGRITDSATGRGIADVTVSDGYNCCQTDADGHYSIDANAIARTINVTIPAAYEIPVGNDGCPAFFKRISAGTSTYDFTLTPRAKADDRFTLVIVSDAHVQTESNLARFSTKAIPDVQNTISELEASGNAGTIIGIGLGDQLWDNMSMAANVRKQYTSLSTSKGTMPFFYCIGNHDHQSGLKGIDYNPDYYATQNFVDNFGPTDYSFDIGNAHIVVMDNIKYNGVDDGEKIKYSQSITGEQLHWLRQDVAAVKDKEHKVMIFCTHAPIYSAIGNGTYIQKALCEFNEGHMMTGHIHNLTNDSHAGMYALSGREIIEHNIQSLSGMWWLADLSPNGTPAGYGVFTFKGGQLESEYNKITKEDKSFQMRVYSGNDSYPGYAWDNSYKGKFLVRVWDGDDAAVKDNAMTWWLDFVQNGKAVPMTRLSEPIVDKCSASYIVKVLGSPYGTGGSATSYSWWMIDAPCGDPAAEKDWEIVARHSINGGPEMIYRTSKLSRDGSGYALDIHF